MCGGAGHLLVGEGGHHHPRLREDDAQRHQHCKVSPYSYRYMILYDKLLQRSDFLCHQHSPKFLK
jgi:hypothetical protein